MNEERRMILEMVRNGSITIEEAERLMGAIGEEQEALALRPTGGRQPKRIRVQAVEDGNTIVNVRIPFPLVKVALKLGKAGALLGAKYAAKSGKEAQFLYKVNDIDILAYVNEIDIDEVLESLSDGEISLPYTMVDMVDREDGKSTHVEVILE